MNRLLASIVFVSSVASADPATRSYVVKAGDTCLGIAVRELGDQNQLAVLHKMNPQLGTKMPHVLVPGQLLTLPGNGGPADANLSYQHGTVEVRRPGEADWIHTNTGADLFRTWRVGSREQSSAQVTFLDKSVISMRENTMVVIYGPTLSSAKTLDVHAQLETGVLRSRLASLDGRVLVETSSGTATFGQGTAVVEVDPSHTTKISNHHGKPATLTSRSAKPKTIDISPGFGSLVATGAEPTPPKPLPPSPMWSATTPVVLGWAGKGGYIRAAWTGSPAAAKYRLELARDRELTQVDLRMEAPASANSIELQAVPAGAYFLSMAAVDKDGFESIATEPQPVQVVEIPLPSTAVTADGTPSVALGSVLPVPANMQCTLDGQPSLVATAPGSHEIACGSTALKIDVVAVQVIAPSVQKIAVAAPAVWIDVVIEGSPVGDIVAHAPAGFTVTSTARTANGVRVQIAATKTATAGNVALALAGAAEIPLGSFPIGVEAVAPPPVMFRELGIDAFGGLGTRREGTYGRVGIGGHVRATSWLTVDASVQQQTSSSSNTTFEIGMSAHAVSHPVEPSLRAGFIGHSGSEPDSGPGAYLGVGVLIPVRSWFGVFVNLDGVYDAMGPSSYTVAGLRFGLL